MSKLSRNQRYLLNCYERSPRGCALDYGCGDGDLVGAAVEREYDFWGTEPYYDETDFQVKSEARTPLAAQDRIKLLGSDNTIPWPDETFDWICSGQVIEHVKDLDRAVAELARVTKPGGINLHNFPTLERVRESHNGVPFYARVPDRFRASWAKAAYRTRLAYRFDQKDPDEWWRDTSTWHDGHVFLRSVAVVRDAFAQYFDIQDASVDKLSFHLGVSLPDASPLRRLESWRHGQTLLMTRR